MIDLIAWLLTINESANLREELRVLKSQKPAPIPLSVAQRLAALEAENEELKLRLGLLIRMLAQRKGIDVQEFVAAYKEIQSSHRP